MSLDPKQQGMCGATSADCSYVYDASGTIVSRCNTIQRNNDIFFTKNSGNFGIAKEFCFSISRTSSISPDPAKSPACSNLTFTSRGGSPCSLQLT